MPNRVGAIVASVIIFAALAVVAWKVTAPDPYVSRVHDIYATPQTHGGEIVDNLVALGPNAVPAIGSALLAEPEFPIVFFRALAEIGDERGAEPIIEFIFRQTPFSDEERSALTAEAIRALRGTRSPAACDPIATILRDESAHPRVRLASASTCARLCDGETRTEAQSFILSMYGNRSLYSTQRRPAFTPPELYSALIDVDSDESIAILLNRLESGGAPGILQAILIYLSGKEGENVIDSVQRVLNDSDSYELVVRLAAARSILDMDRPLTQTLRDSIDELTDEATPDMYGQTIADEAQQLRTRAAER